MDKAKEKKAGYLLGKMILGMTVPFVISSVFLYLDGGQSIRNIMPSYNDEDFYFHQIKAILTYGQPLGYYGYDGSHALIGNFGFHGFIILVPYVAFGSLFGMKFYTIALANMGLMAICNLIYILLYKPGYKQLFSFSILILSPMLLYFINTNMVEGENYFFAVVSAMLMVRILQDEENRTVKIALGVLIVWATLSKITWTILVFPYLLILLKRNRRLSGVFKVILAGGVTLLSGAVGYVVFLLFRASYFKNLSLMELYAERIAMDGLGQGFSFILEVVRKNIVITWLDTEPPWLAICRVFIITMGVLTIAFAILEHRENSLSFIPTYMVLGFVFGVAILYAGGREAVRTVYSGGVFAQAFMLIELSQVKRKEFKKVFTSVSVLFFILGFIIQATWGWGVYKRHYYDSNNQAHYQELEQYMSMIEPQVVSRNPWDNTLVLALTSYPDRIYELFIPTGIGLNYYWYLPQDLSGFEAGYVLLSNRNLEDMERLRIAGYFVLGKDANTTLLTRISREDDIK